MKRSWLWVMLAGCVAVSSTPSSVLGEGYPFAGVDLGVVQPIQAFDDYSKTGGMFSPYAGYMFNDYIGLTGQLQVFGNPNRDRPGLLDSDATWAIGGLAGPKFALPIGNAELYAIGQGGIFTGLAPHASITDTSAGFSAGGGINAPIMKNVSLGLFGRFNRLYQRVHGDGDVKYITAGLGLQYSFKPEEAPPPPPAPVAKPAPPAPPAKRKLVLRGVNFDFDKSNIRADARPVLDEAVRVLKEEGGIAVIAEGHTDSKGTDTYNQALSVRRANAVREYLVKGGVAASRIKVEGLGESRPVASNETADGRAQNRRVELRVVND